MRASAGQRELDIVRGQVKSLQGQVQQLQELLACREQQHRYGQMSFTASYRGGITFTMSVCLCVCRCVHSFFCYSFGPITLKLDQNMPLQPISELCFLKIFLSKSHLKMHLKCIERQQSPICALCCLWWLIISLFCYTYMLILDSSQ